MDDTEQLKNRIRNLLKERYTKLYTHDEMLKLIEAYEKKYNIPECDELPYHPKPIQVHLMGETKDD